MSKDGRERTSIYISEDDQYLMKRAREYVDKGNARSFTELVMKALREYLGKRLGSMKVMEKRDEDASV